MQNVSRRAVSVVMIVHGSLKIMSNVTCRSVIIMIVIGIKGIVVHVHLGAIINQIPIPTMDNVHLLAK